jgi:hypothetical protein
VIDRAVEAYARATSSSSSNSVLMGQSGLDGRRSHSNSNYQQNSPESSPSSFRNIEEFDEEPNQHQHQQYSTSSASVNQMPPPPPHRPRRIWED